MRQLIFATTLAAAAALSACGRNDSGGTASAPNATSTAAAPAAAPAAPAVTPPQAAAPAAPAPATPSPVATPAVGTGTTTAAAAGSGADVYSKVCTACHAAGVAGAPKLGDKADWAARAAKGKDTLYTHAIQGFTGQKGVMPPKGGAATLTDSEVKSAVDFMLAGSS